MHFTCRTIFHYFHRLEISNRSNRREVVDFLNAYVGNKEIIYQKYVSSYFKLPMRCKLNFEFHYLLTQITYRDLGPNFANYLINTNLLINNATSDLLIYHKKTITQQMIEKQKFTIYNFIDARNSSMHKNLSYFFIVQC